NDEAKPAYALLRDAMDDPQRVAIGTAVIRRKQYLAAGRPTEGALALCTMGFAHEVVRASPVKGIPARSGGKGRQKERALAGQIIDALASDWEPERYHDTYTEELRTLIKRRSKGAKAEEPEEAPEQETAEVVDLMEALEASVKRTRGAP